MDTPTPSNLPTSSSRRPHDGDDGPVIPGALARAVHRAYGDPGVVDARVDAAVDRAIGSAHGIPARRTRQAHRRGRWLVLSGSVAAAAAVLLAWWIVALPRQGAVPGGAGPLATGEGDPRDVNGDGRVDILDARRLGALVREDRALLDLNGDGVSDGLDVDALAFGIVAIGGAS